MLVGDPARPVAGELVPQRLRLADVLVPVTLLVVAGEGVPVAGPAVVGMMVCPCLLNDPGGVVTDHPLG